MPLFVGHMAW